jgi:acetyl-CoA acetyltransferase
MRKAYITGIAMSPVGRHDLLEHELLIPILIDALNDSELTLNDVQGFVMSHPRVYTKQRYFANWLTHQLRIKPSAILMEVMGDGLTGALAVRQAVQEVLLGNADVVLASAVSLETTVNTDLHLSFTLRALGDVDYTAPFGPTALAVMAMETNRYIYEYGAKIEDLHAIGVKNRLHASMNPIAQFRKPITIADIEASPMIVEPLHLYEVSPRSDGAAAVVVSSEPLGRPGRSIEVKAIGFDHTGVHMSDDRPGDMLDFGVVRGAADKVFKGSGVGLSDVDFFEIYAPAPIHEVLVTEALGLFPRGQGASAAAAGATRFDGLHPVSTSGGCICRGHPPLATPIYDICEVVTQLRGEAGERQVRSAEHGMTFTEMGMYNGTVSFLMGGAER